MEILILLFQENLKIKMILLTTLEKLKSNFDFFKNFSNIQIANTKVKLN